MFNDGISYEPLMMEFLSDPQYDLNKLSSYIVTVGDTTVKCLIQTCQLINGPNYLQDD